MVFLLLTQSFPAEGGGEGGWLCSWGPLVHPHRRACNKTMTPRPLPLCLGQLEMEGPHNSLVLGYTGNVRVTEADPPSPSPQEGRAEGAVLKHF